MRKKLHVEVFEQFLHALWSGSTCLLPFVAWKVEGLPVWAAYTLTVVAAVSLTVLVVREIEQKAHKPGGILKHWPWLDTLGYAIGAVAGVACGIWALP